MATIIVPTTNPLIDSPYVDPDESGYGELPTEKQFELRVAHATVGTGTLVEQRNSTSQIVEAERVGETLDLLTATTGWTNETNVVVTTVASQPTGYSGNSLQIQATAASSTDRQAAKNIPFNLAVYGGDTEFRIHRRVSSVTNLTRWTLRFGFGASPNTNWAEYELANSGTALNTWAELTFVKGTPFATAGTVDWANVTWLIFRVDVSGAYTGNLDVRDLRIGTTRTNKTTPDGNLAAESTYDFRVRYRDAATPTSTFGPWSSWVTMKVSLPPVVTQTAPNDAASVTDPTPAYTWTFSSPGGKAQASAYVSLYEVVGGQDELVGVQTLTGTGLSITQAPFVLSTGKTYAWTVTALDTDGLATTSARRTFTTTFAQPAAPTGLTTTPDIDTSSVSVAWTNTPPTFFTEWRVYRRPSGGTITRITTDGKTWEEGDPLLTAPPLVDYHVPEGVTVEYLVSVHSGSASSEGESVTTSVTSELIVGRWVNVVPGQLDRTFEVIPSSFNETPELQLERTEVIDRPTVHTSVGELLGPILEFSLFVSADELDTIAKLRSISVDDELDYAILKSPHGDVWRVQYGTIPRSYGGGGNSSASITATVVTS